jgi:tetratricopeptide (TPR) repeat protein
MKRVGGIFWLFAVLLLVVRVVPAAEVLTNDTIVTMVKAGLGEELVIGKIKISQGQYDVSTDGLLRLKSEGVGEPIIKAMIEASADPGPAGQKAPGLAVPASPEGQAERDAIALYGAGRTLEAAVAFEKLIAQNPSEDRLKVWKALVQLEQARGMRESRAPQYKTLVLGAWAILKSVDRSQQLNPGWNLAVGKALWLNDRRERGKGYVEKALALRPDYAEALLLLGDLAYDEWVSSPNVDTTTKWRLGVAIRKRYETAISLPDISSVYRAEAFFKMGVVSAELENKKDDARGYWERAAAADPVSRYGRMAQEKLAAMPAK